MSAVNIKPFKLPEETQVMLDAANEAGLLNNGRFTKDKFEQWFEYTQSVRKHCIEDFTALMKETAADYESLTVNNFVEEIIKRLESKT